MIARADRRSRAAHDLLRGDVRTARGHDEVVTSMYFRSRSTVCEGNKAHLAVLASKGEHLMTTTCDNVERSDSDLERLLRRSRGLAAASEPLIQRAMAVFGRRRSAAPAATVWRRILAVVSFDSGVAGLSTFGMRSAGGSARQMLCSAGCHDVDLRVIPSSQTCVGAGCHEWILAGQVLGPEADGIVIVTDATGLEAPPVALTALGEFFLPAMPPGNYHLTLRLRLDQVEIVLPGVRLPPREWPSADHAPNEVR